jgi:small subunit ribosomal protein S18e
MYALTAIPGIGRRVSNIICKKAEVDMRKRAGDLSADEIERIVSIVGDPKKFKIPEWIVNRRRDRVDGKSHQLVSNQVATKLREDIEALKKVRAHRGLRHYWGVKVRGQHTGASTRLGGGERAWKRELRAARCLFFCCGLPLTVVLVLTPHPSLSLFSSFPAGTTGRGRAWAVAAGGK